MTSCNSCRARTRYLREGRSLLSSWAIAILCAATAFLAFLPAIGADLVNLDDDWNLEFNPRFQGLSARHLHWMLTTSSPMGHYQPLTWLTYAIDFTLVGHHPESYHRTNVLLHAAATIAFYALAVALISVVRERGGQLDAAARRSIRLAAAFSALVFAVHPLRVESVAWATGRNDLLSGMFALLSATAWVRYGGKARCVRWKYSEALSVIGLALVTFCLAIVSIDLSTPGSLGFRAFGALGIFLAAISFIILVRRILRARGVRQPNQRPIAFAAASFFLFLSFLCKSWAVGLPFVFLILDLWPLARSDRLNLGEGRLARSRAVLDLILEKLPLFVLCGVFAVIASWAKSDLQILVKTDQTFFERVGQAFYGLAFYPLKTLWPHGLVVINDLPNDISLSAPRFLIPMLCVMACAVVLWLFRRRCPAVAAAIASYAILVAPVLGLVQFNTLLVADRYSYVACMPLALLLGGIWLVALDRLTRGRWVLGVLTVSALAILSVATWRLSTVWRTSESLYLHALKFGETSKVLSNLALVYNEKALEDPLRRAELLNEALSLSTRAIKLARESELQDPQYHLTRGTVQLNRGELDEAITEIQTFVKAKPDYSQGRINLGLALMRAGRFREAVYQLQHAVQLAGERAEAWRLLGMAFEGNGERSNATQAYRRAAALDPGNANIRDRLRSLEATR